MTRATTRGRRMRLTALAAGALAAALSLSLASCVSVPGSGAVQVGLSDLQQAERLVQLGASGPSAGDTQEQLVRGFLIAANSNINDYAVAREFLSTAYATQWDPYYGVLVSEGTKPYRSDGDDAGMLSLALAANVDGEGTMLPIESGASTELRFEFVKQGDEWRISSAPSGLIVDRPNFTTTWSSHELYFLGPGDRMISETRWFLSRTALATEIVRALIEGPSERLQQVVHSGFPPGVQLAKNTVPVADGLARVDLLGDGLEAPQAQDEIIAQLQASLQSVPGINRVELLIDGVSVHDPAEAIPASPLSMATMKPAGFIEGTFGIISASEVEPVTDISEHVEELDPDSVSLSRSRTVAAVRNSDGVSMVAEGSVALVDQRNGLLEPSTDDDLWVWTVSAADPSVMRVTAVDGTQHVLSAPWLADLNVRSVRVSPGGSLVAALINDGERSRVLVAGVIRDNDGVPTGLSPEAPVEMWTNGEAIDLDWVDSLHFVTLSKQGNAGKVTVGGPGTFAIEQGSVPNAVHVAGGGSRAQIRVSTSDGKFFAPQGGSGWQQVGSSIDVLAKRG
ncbi:MAG: LpqB family beta-propeller domain-containing protein [Leucobacter sp.]